MRYDAELIKQQNDLRDHAARYVVLRRESHSEMSGPCPKCGGTDRFHCKADMFFCRQCYDLDNGKPHDLFGFYQWLEGWDFLTCCRNLAGDILPEPRRKVQPERKPILDLGIPADDVLQERAMQIAVDCAAMLWEPAGAKALAWLQARGLQGDTLKAHYIGFNSEAGRKHGFYVPRGVTIPHWQESTNTISGIKIRLAANEGRKYTNILGSKPSLYLADDLLGHDVAVVAEGEFDALLLSQFVGDLAGVCALGSASNHTAAIDAGLPYLLPITRLLVATDNDDGGEAAAAAILERTRRARRLKVPDGNDITDFWRIVGPAGLRAWVSDALAELESQPESDPVVMWAVEHLGAVVVG